MRAPPTGTGLRRSAMAHAPRVTTRQGQTIAETGIVARPATKPTANATTTLDAPDSGLGPHHSAPVVFVPRDGTRLGEVIGVMVVTVLLGKRCSAPVMALEQDLVIRSRRTRIVMGFS